jgi:hypothetical protein
MFLVCECKRLAHLQRVCVCCWLHTDKHTHTNIITEEKLHTRRNKYPSQQLLYTYTYTCHCAYHVVIRCVCVGKAILLLVTLIPPSLIYYSNMAWLCVCVHLVKIKKLHRQTHTPVNDILLANILILKHYRSYLTWWKEQTKLQQCYNWH